MIYRQHFKEMKVNFFCFLIWRQIGKPKHNWDVYMVENVIGWLVGIFPLFRRFILCLNKHICIVTKESYWQCYSLSLYTAVSLIFTSVRSAVGAVRHPISQRALLLWPCSDVLFSDPSTLAAPAYPSYITDTALTLLYMGTQQ